MPKKFNPKYKDHQYQIDRDNYFTHDAKNPLKQLSMDFCIRFVELLPEMDGGNGGNDSDDYMAWGFALWGIWQEDEDGGHEVWTWINHYERMLKGKDITTHDFKNTKELVEYLDSLDYTD